MSLPVIILLIGLLYVVLLGGLALFRREGLSMQFALEAVAITAIASGLVAVTSVSLHPVLFLILLYLITMRVRLLVDLGTVLAKQGNNSPAYKLYTLAASLWPDSSGRLVVKINQATLLLQENKLDEAVEMFDEILQQAEQGYLGIKYEAVAHFNLGVVYLRKELPARATAEFNEVINTWPTSLYAQRAQEALDRQRVKNF